MPRTKRAETIAGGKTRLAANSRPYIRTFHSSKEDIIGILTKKGKGNEGGGGAYVGSRRTIEGNPASARGGTMS